MSEIASGAKGAWSYRAGSWFAVFGSKVTVLLPESQKDQVVSLWALVDGGAGFDEVLDGLLASGLSRIPGFVLISTDDGPTRVLLRGHGVTATLVAAGEDVMLDGAASHTWVERSVEDVTALSVTVPDEAAAGDELADLPIVTGLVRVARVDLPAAARRGSADEAGTTAVPLAMPEGIPAAGSGSGPSTGVLGGALAGGALAGGDVVAGGSLAGSGAGPSMATPETQTDAQADGLVDPVAADPVMLEAEPSTPGTPPLEAPPVRVPDAEWVPVDESLDEAGPELVDEAGPELVDEAEPELVDEAEAELVELTDAPRALDQTGPLGHDGAPAETPGSAISGDPLTDPLPLEGDTAPDLPPAPAPVGEAAPDDWVTPWDNPAPEPPFAEAAAETTPPPDPLAEPDTPAFPPPALPPVEGQTEMAPPGWVPPPPPSDAGVSHAPPLPVGSWEPLGGNFPPPPPDIPDHDGLTMTGAGDEDAAEPSIAVQAPPAALGQPVARLLVSDGQTIAVDRAVLIGRAPEARRFTSTEQPMLVTVPSRLHEISSTHVEVRPGTGADHGTAVVTDMGSTNGTVLVRPGLGPEDLKPGIAVQLIPGAVINLGDGITIQVTRP